MEELEKSQWVSYENGNYRVYLNLKDGTKVRFTEDDEYRPEYPESMDIKITNRCGMGCPWCHENSLPDGMNADLDQPFIDTLRPYMEIAVGGGNILEHPGLESFLTRLRELKCVPSITLNQRHFCENFDRVLDLHQRNLVFGVGVSLTEPTDELVSKMKAIPTSVIHTINGILTGDDVRKLAHRGLKALVLGYKDIRRGSSYLSGHDRKVFYNMAWMESHLDELFSSFDTVCFDNLALDQLPVREYLGKEDWERIYMGDDGNHTFYIDMVEGEYAVSSTSTDRHPIGDLDVHGMFQHVKELSKG